METPTTEPTPVIVPPIGDLLAAAIDAAEAEDRAPPPRVLTIRVPLELRLALGEIARQRGTSMNKLAAVAIYKTLAELARGDATKENLEIVASKLFPNMKGRGNGS